MTNMNDKFRHHCSDLNWLYLIITYLESNDVWIRVLFPSTDVLFSSTESSCSMIRVDTHSIQVRVLYRHPIKCKVPAVRVSVVEELHKSFAGIPLSRWCLSAPLLTGLWIENGSLPCCMSETLSYFDKLLHLGARPVVSSNNFGAMVAIPLQR